MEECPKCTVTISTDSRAVALACVKRLRMGSEVEWDQDMFSLVGWEAALQAEAPWLMIKQGYKTEDR